MQEVRVALRIGDHTLESCRLDPDVRLRQRHGDRLRRVLQIQQADTSYLPPIPEDRIRLAQRVFSPGVPAKINWNGRPVLRSSSLVLSNSFATSGTSVWASSMTTSNGRFPFRRRSSAGTKNLETPRLLSDPGMCRGRRPEPGTKRSARSTFTGAPAGIPRRFPSAAARNG